MKIRIVVNMDNAAFDDNPAELADILSDVAAAVDHGQTGGRCMDSNGNSVGQWEVRK